MKTSNRSLWYVIAALMVVVMQWPVSSGAEKINGGAAEAVANPQMSQQWKTEQKNPEELPALLDFSKVAAGIAVSSIDRSNVMVLYQCRYDPFSLSGDVLAISAKWHEDRLVPGPVVWRAANQFQMPDQQWQTRRIISYGGAGSTPSGIPFRYESLSPEQHATLLPTDNGQPPDPGEVQELVAFLRGKASPGFRQRHTLLGDIQHAAPAVSGNSLFIGANDGMLHAFDARTGIERFAYVPNLLLGTLRHLSHKDYTYRNRAYVDATPSIGQVLVGHYKRHTYLVGGLGQGGRGIYCLLLNTAQRERAKAGYTEYRSEFDIDTLGPQDSEEQFSRLVQWEYPSHDPSSDGMDNDGDGLADEPDEMDPHIGYNHGQGYAVNANAPTGVHRPVVIFGNGYNSPDGRAVLVILDAHTGKILRKIFTSADKDNGLSTPALIDVDMDRRIDTAYAGDLRGNLWKFDLSNPDPARWGVATDQALAAKGNRSSAAGESPQPLFQTPGQPITGRPDVMAVNPACDPKATGYMVIFGTGRHSGADNGVDNQPNGIFGVRDSGHHRAPQQRLGTLLNPASGRLSSGNYLKRCSVVQAANIDGDTHRILNQASNKNQLGAMHAAAAGQSDEATECAGWFVPFPSASNSQERRGERVTGRAVVRGGRAVVISMVPRQASAAANNGSSWVYVLDACKGLAVGNIDHAFTYPKQYSGGITGDPLVIKNPFRPGPDHILAWDPSGSLIQSAFEGERQGRVSWRQITK